jgi:energy-coupling factor transporter ATP-binding protein EcfA2
MKTLNRIILVNWYLLLAEEINIQGNTALVGANGSGKSSIIDAIQTLLLGGDQSHIRFNASATDKKSKRTLLEYCLGVVRDPQFGGDSDSEFAPRERAVTYIVASFYDDQTNDETAIGLAIHAQLLDRVCHIDGRFIAPRLTVNLRDFIEDVKGHDQPIAWERVKEDLRRRCKAQKSELIVVPEAGQFVTRMGQALGNAGRSLEPKRFAKNLQNAITFKPISDVSQFVRDYILEYKPVRVKELQDSLRNYREIADKTAQVKERIEVLRLVLQFYQTSLRHRFRAQLMDWVEKEATVTRFGDEIAGAETALHIAQEQLDALVKLKSALDSQRQDAINRRAQVQAALDADTTESKKRELVASRGAEEERRQTAARSLLSARSSLRSTIILHDHRDLLSVEVQNRLDDLSRLVPATTDLASPDWPENPAAIAELATAMQPAIQEVKEQLRGACDQRVVNAEIRKKQLYAMRQAIDSLTKGEAPLSDSTRRLVGILNVHKIKSVPLCDMIDVSDERWRTAIESFLATNREALIVEPGDARLAVTKYRQEGKGLFGARIVNTLKTADWSNRTEKGSLAEVVKTDNVHARAYVNRLLGRVMRVESEQELLKHERAITPDCMLAANGSIQRMREESSILGRKAREQRLKRLQTEFQELSAEDFRENKRTAIEQDLLEKLAVMHKEFSTMPDIVALAENRCRAEAQLKRIAEDVEKLDLSSTASLREELDSLSTTVKQLDDSVEAKEIEAGNCRVAVATHNQALKFASDSLEKASVARAQSESLPGFDPSEASAAFEKIMAEYEGNPQKAEEAANRRAGSNRVQAIHAADGAKTKLNEYALRYSVLLPGSALPPEQRNSELSIWTQDTLKSLEDTELAELTKQAEDARVEAEHIFNAQFIGQLKDNLSKVDDALDELNRNLQKREFHGEIYRFKSTYAPEYEPIVRWVKVASEEDRANIGSLFDKSLSPESEHYEGRRRIQDLLLTSSNSENLEAKLADYRNYFLFDVEMKDVKGRGSTFLSKRLGKGSGGEHQTPFYVAISASLAATYRIDRSFEGQPRSGMALALFDEAFSKLDVQNTSNALQFLRDLGMQVLVAAPNEKYAPLAEEMDTMVNVLRDGGTVKILVDYLKPAARALLASDNPYKKVASV